MKVLIYVFLLVSFFEKPLLAQEGAIIEVKPESDISSNANKFLRKVKRNSMDETCEMTKSKETCDNEKREHDEGAEADRSDTKKRKLAKDTEKLNKRNKQIIEEKECHNVDGKIQCAVKIIKNRVDDLVE